jgi:serine/threonine protein kinase
MGEVWEARHERTKGRVAIKLLLADLGRHEGVLQRFQREVEITSGLNHPNIVRISDADKLRSGRPFLVMEFLEGHDLSEVARRAEPLGLADTVEIVEQVATGLQAAHDRSVVHRDLKPANIFVVPLPGTGRMLVKILDFGISKALDGLSQLTQSRNMMGTPNYMAPEQATRGASSVDARADQFSLAAIAYELLTGRMAFAGDGIMNVIFKVINETPPSFSSWDIMMPPGVEGTVMKGLSKLPTERFGTVREFADTLRRAADDFGTERRIPALVRTEIGWPTQPFSGGPQSPSNSVALPSFGDVSNAVAPAPMVSDRDPWPARARNLGPVLIQGGGVPAATPPASPNFAKTRLSATTQASQRRKWAALTVGGLIPVLALAAVWWVRDQSPRPQVAVVPVAAGAKISTGSPPAAPPASEPVVVRSSAEAVGQDDLARTYLDSAESMLKDRRLDVARNTLARASQLRITHPDLAARRAQLSRALSASEEATRARPGSRKGANKTRMLAAMNESAPTRRAPRGEPRSGEAESPSQAGAPAMIRLADSPAPPPASEPALAAPAVAASKPSADPGPSSAVAGSLPASSRPAAPNAASGMRQGSVEAGAMGAGAKASGGAVFSVMPKSPIPKPRLPRAAEAETSDEITHLCQQVEAVTIFTGGVSPEFARGITQPLRRALGGQGKIYPVAMYYFIIREASLRHDNKSAAQALVAAHSDGFLLKLRDLPAVEPAP